MPLSVEVSKIPFPEVVATLKIVTWKHTVIVWGRVQTAQEDSNKIYFHQSGKWTLKETVGDAPLDAISSVGFATLHVINSKMLVFGVYGDGSVIYSLDLNSLVWSRLTPGGDGPSAVRSSMSSWVYAGKVYCFGGYINSDEHGNCSTNDMFCYNISKNHWDRVPQKGGIPSPRVHCKVIVKDDAVFLWGGACVRLSGGSVDDQFRNDLHVLNMKTMTWTGIHEDLPPGTGPGKERGHTASRISHSRAVFITAFSIKSNKSYGDECWLLNLENVKKPTDISQVWSRVPTHIMRSGSESVMDPVSKKLWLIGGRDVDRDNPNHPWQTLRSRWTTDVLEVTLDVPSLKNTLLDHVARSVRSEDPRLSSAELPVELKRDIDACKIKVGKLYRCTAAVNDCWVCQNRSIT